MNIYDIIQTDLAFITNIRGPQLIIILLVVFLLFGSKRLPDMARGIGKALREFRKSAFEVEKDFRSAMDETPNTAVKPQEAGTVSSVSTEQNVQQ